MDAGKILPFTFGALTGGLAGAVFTWFVNLPSATVVAYSISTTSVSAGANVRTTVPGLRLQIGNEEVGALYTHTIDFSSPAGPHVERVEVAVIAAEPAVRTFGLSSSPPSPLHEMTCDPLDARSVRCKIGPIGGNNRGPFIVSWATDRPQPPRVVTTAKAVDVVPLVEYAARREPWWQLGRWILTGASIFGALLGFTFSAVLYNAVQRRARIAKAQADVRSIASAVSMYTAHMGGLPKSLRDVTEPSRNTQGESSGAFLAAVPQAPTGWTPYVYTPERNGTFSVESSGDGTIARVP